LVVKLAPEMVEEIKPRIAEMCEAHAYAGAVLVRGEAGLRKGDVVIDWSDGIVSSSPQETEERINALVTAALGAAEAQ
jgi:flagellar biosynthesis/type III secretory pathway protein FliH